MNDEGEDGTQIFIIDYDSSILSAPIIIIIKNLRPINHESNRGYNTATYPYPQDKPDSKNHQWSIGVLDRN